MNIVQAMRDPNVFGPMFPDLEPWRAWIVVLKALFGLPMGEEERKLFTELTGRLTPPERQALEAWFVVGRRGGKSRIAALIGVYLACFVDYRPYLAAGERGIVAIIAADRKQAATILSYVLGFLRGVPMLAQLIESDTAEGIELTNGISIEILTGSYRTVRGRTVVAGLCDETAFWRSEDSANPDVEIINALKPAMATIPNAMLLGLSSPYRKAGVLYEAHRRHYGVDGDPVLVLQAASRTMNPTLPQEFVDNAIKEDPASASAEYLAQFRDDLSGFLDPDWIVRATRSESGDLPPMPGIAYRAFVDPSGGKSDAFTLGIAHADKGVRVLDVIRRRPPPFSPESVVSEFAGIMARYGITTATGDRYGAEWVVEAFSKVGIHLRHSSKSKSEIYLEVEPAFATGQADIPPDRHLQNELRQLERRTHRGGRDTVDHPTGGHDDVANAACGALWIVEGVKLSAPRIRILESAPTVRGFHNDGRMAPITSGFDFRGR